MAVSSRTEQPTWLVFSDIAEVLYCGPSKVEAQAIADQLGYEVHGPYVLSSGDIATP